MELTAKTGSYGNLLAKFILKWYNTGKGERICQS